MVTKFYASFTLMEYRKDENRSAEKIRIRKGVTTAKDKITAA